jgi:hypothetical protein
MNRAAIRAYFRSIFTYNAQKQQKLEPFQDAAKTTLDFIRNLAVIGVFLFFFEKTQSKLLNMIVFLGFTALTCQVAITLLRYDFNPFSFVQT